MEQILIYNCVSNNQNYILGDLGSISDIDVVNPNVTFAPLPSDYRNYYSQDIF